MRVYARGLRRKRPTCPRSGSGGGALRKSVRMRTAQGAARLPSENRDRPGFVAACRWCGTCLSTPHRMGARQSMPRGVVGLAFQVARAACPPCRDDGKNGGRSITTVESPHLLRLVRRCRRVCRYVCRVRQRLHVQRLHRIVAAGFRRLARGRFRWSSRWPGSCISPWASSADRSPTALAPGSSQ